jgi:hypothetical protein
VRLSTLSPPRNARCGSGPSVRGRFRHTPISFGPRKISSGECGSGSRPPSERVRCRASGSHGRGAPCPPPTTSIVPWTTSVTPFAERSNQRIVIVAQAAVRSGTNRIVTAVLQVILDHRDRDDFLVTAAHAIRLSWALSLVTPSAPNVGRALAASRLASADASHDTPDGDEFRFCPCPRIRCLRSVTVSRSSITGAAAKPKCTRAHRLPHHVLSMVVPNESGAGLLVLALMLLVEARRPALRNIAGGLIPLLAGSTTMKPGAHRGRCVLTQPCSGQRVGRRLLASRRDRGRP